MKCKGYHGTTLAHALEMERGVFRPLSVRNSKWLGKGLYFFEDNVELATTYARAAAADQKGEPAILFAEIGSNLCGMSWR
jgi:hypothetical protein